MRDGRRGITRFSAPVPVRPPILGNLAGTAG
jgi:hypothetical protein